MLRTLKIKLAPTEEQHVIMLGTMERFNEACNWIAAEAFGGRVTNKIAIQKIVYYAGPSINSARLSNTRLPLLACL